MSVSAVLMMQSSCKYIILVAMFVTCPVDPIVGLPLIRYTCNYIIIVARFANTL
jgi:hypothetical protein